MTIIEALKDKERNYGIRLTIGDRWLIFAEDSGEWEVWESKRYGKKTRCLYKGANEEDAVDILTAD